MPETALASARENTDTLRWPDSSAGPTTTCTATEPEAGSINGDCNVSSSTTEQPTSSPARIANSTNPAPGKHHHAIDGVIGQPSLRCRREAAGQHHPTRVRQLHHRTQQRVLTGSQPQTCGVHSSAVTGKPKPPSLKGIRRQLDELGSGQHRAPIHPTPDTKACAAEVRNRRRPPSSRPRVGMTMVRRRCRCSRWRCPRCRRSTRDADWIR